MAHGAELEPKLLVQPFNEALFVDRPGGGPLDFGAAQSSAVTAVAGFKSPRAFEVGSLFCGLHNKAEVFDAQNVTFNEKLT